MLKAILIVGLGGAIGSILRWLLGLSLNAIFPTIPLGTLTANLIAGYLIGICLSVFVIFPNITLEWKLFLITGCLGGLSTFSTFSAEVALLLQHGRALWAFITIAAHVIGSISMTLLGIATISCCKLLFK